MEATQFVWTKKYNRILALFCDEVPLNANRHYFKSFPNSFSGRSALDTMERVLLAVFPENDIQRQNARKVLELLLRDGTIVAVNRSIEHIKDEKDVFYRFGKQFSAEKYFARPRRSVSVDDNRKRFMRPRMSISTNEFKSDPHICAQSTSSEASTSSITNSMESVNEDEEETEQRSDRKMNVDAAAMRFIHWIQQDDQMSEQQRRKTMRAFQAHYPQIYSNYLGQSCKSASLDSNYRLNRQQCLDVTLSPSTSQFSLQSDPTRCLNESSRSKTFDNGISQRKTSNRLTEADIHMQLLNKLDSVISTESAYSETDRTRILKYFKHVFPSVYFLRFDEERPLLKKIREFLPKISSEVR